MKEAKAASTGSTKKVNIVKKVGGKKLKVSKKVVKKTVSNTPEHEEDIVEQASKEIIDFITHAKNSEVS